MSETSTVFDTHILTSIEDVLDEVLGADQSNVAGLTRIYQAMRYSALAGGKRLRPYLTVAVADMFKVPRTYSLRAGCAVELVHCYSLIHDDLPAMDNSDLRRGRPTSHIEFDEATAILAGDGLLTHAFAVLSAQETHRSAEVRSNLVMTLAEAAGPGGMVGGQMIDILAETGVALAEDIELLQALKTGALIRAACRMGVLLSEDRTNAMRHIDMYADAIGLAFQIADDLLDIDGSQELTGKPVGQDASNGKPTFVELLGEGGARKKAASLVKDAKAAVEIFAERSAPLNRIADFIISRRS